MFISGQKKNCDKFITKALFDECGLFEPRVHAV